MSGLRILYFRDSLLDGSEMLETDDLVSALKRASSRHPHLTAEVWSGEGKIAVVRPASISRER